MSLHEEIISGVAGAVSGAVAGALTAWWFAPTQAEREERGRRRLEGRGQIAAAIGLLIYQITEARGRLFRLEEVGDLLDRERFLEFAGSVKRGSIFLRSHKRFLVKHRARKVAGRLVWRLAEIVPSEHYGDVDEASLLKATADTRTSVDKRVFGAALADFPPTSARWDEVLGILEKMRKAYPG